MKHIVFVLGAYFPRFSAVGLCAHRVIDALKEDFKISVIAVGDDAAVEPRIENEGIPIYRVSTKTSAKRAALQLSLRASPSVFSRARMFFLRTETTCRRLFSRETVDRDLISAYRQQLVELKDIDIIVPLVFPIETVVAALDHAALVGNPIVVPYIFDNFVDSRSLHVLQAAKLFKRQRHLKLESDMIKRSSAILAMHPLAPHFINNFGEAARKKVLFLEHPLLMEGRAATPGPSSSTVLVYTGALIRKVREPDYVLDLLAGLAFDRPLHVDFYVMGNAAGIVKSGRVGAGVHVTNRGRVDKAVAQAAIEGSNILLNIGEVEGKQISSKIFEYMAAGKPIIHFAYVATDVVSSILRRYPLALCLLQSKELMAENRTNFKSFVERNAAKTIDFAAVAAIFPEALPETTARVLADIVNAGVASGDELDGVHQGKLVTT